MIFFFFLVSLRLKTKARRGGGENLTMGGGGANGRGPDGASVGGIGFCTSVSLIRDIFTNEN